ncbi:uncharacterized protein LOC114941061 [Nylanderia fulva]|uniref:uncharacterized protein LOC114941061 n=1 Tax=Nylanderia fulva TaxID=613905 RepID=UPI0010FB65C9|nr:uncharacterized protein LOC114941061 [Nylanderia fulva]
MNTTNNQKKLLLEWMKLHPEVAKGRLRRKGESKTEMKKLLEDMANVINTANEGPIKSSSEWLKTWKDWKMNVLKKESKRRNYCQGTGGGSPVKINFSPLEEELLDFLTPEAAGLENIPQGGVSFLQDHSNNSQEIFSDENTMQKTEIHFDETENNLPLKKKLCKGSTALNNLNDSNTKSMSIKMIDIQEKKIALKKEQLNIQRQFLEVQRSTLIEIQK